MDRELLVEIGCEELPASWLPGLTTQLAAHLDARLRESRLTAEARSESFSTPRRLAARVARLAERQTDLEELITGPPVAAAFGGDGEPTAAAVGFAKKHGVEVRVLERHSTPRGTYLAHRLTQRGKATVDVLPDVLSGLLRDFTFPKQMRWDAYLEDGKGELVFARPIRWLILTYGGRVVPFVIRRTELSQGPNVQDVRSGSNTYGHRVQTTSGRAGRAVKIKSFEDYRHRLLENFVILDRSERESKIRRELEMHARKLGGRVSGLVSAHSSLLQEVPDLVEYPSVVAGHFPPEFLQLPEEVLTTTMIHHQHYFPVVDEAGRLKSAFLAVANIEAERPEIIARNSERVLTARLRDARFFWDADRQGTLDSRGARLATILFHKSLGSYKEKAERVAALAGWIASSACGRPDLAPHAETAGRLCKADLATDMVRELTELQGTMGGIYAREEGLPEEVWKAIYFHYLPIGVEADAAPTKAELGAAAVVWAAVSLADKLDSIAGMFAVGERPTGSRDPLGLRRQAQGVVKILADLPELTDVQTPLRMGPLVERAAQPFGGGAESADLLWSFMGDRLQFLLEQRGFDIRNVRAVMHGGIAGLSPLEARRKLEALAEISGSDGLLGVARLFKRVKNITKGIAGAGDVETLGATLTEPAERELWSALRQKAGPIRNAVVDGRYRDACTDIASLEPAVSAFFDAVLVMAEDPAIRASRLALLATLRDRILELADISEIVADAT